MPCWSGRFAVAALALGTTGLASATAQRPDLWKNTARYELEYRVQLRDVGRAPDAVALWVPYPAETRDQKILDAHVDSPWPERLTREETYGNRMVYAEPPHTELRFRRMAPHEAARLDEVPR